MYCVMKALTKVHDDYVPIKPMISSMHNICDKTSRHITKILSDRNKINQYLYYKNAYELESWLEHLA